MAGTHRRKCLTCGKVFATFKINGIGWESRKCRKCLSMNSEERKKVRQKRFGVKHE